MLLPASLHAMALFFHSSQPLSKPIISRAIGLRRFLSLSQASFSAEPAKSLPVEAAVEVVLGITAVEVSQTLIRSMDTPSSRDTTVLDLSYSPCPISVPGT